MYADSYILKIRESTRLRSLLLVLFSFHKQIYRFPIRHV